MNFDPFGSLVELSTGLRCGEYTSTELVQGYLDRIEYLDGEVHSYVRVHARRAFTAAEEADRRRAGGAPLGMLDGLPIAVKDLFDIAGEITTCGSRAWLNRRSATTADVVQHLEAAGMCVLGKTHMVEFAFGAWGLNPGMGTPRNPWGGKEHRIPGGSSSGSGVAVAAGLAPAAIGSDTGGSVRTPAALNGLTGLKTTPGLISLAGALPLSHTLDSAGPLCRTAVDAAALAGAMANAPYAASLTVLAAELAQAGFMPDLSGLHIAVLDEADFPTELGPETQQAYNGAQALFASLGATLERRGKPFDFREIARLNGDLIAVESWNVHRDYVEDVNLPLGEWVRKRIIAGKLVGSKRHAELLAQHKEFRSRWVEWLAEGSLFLLPALPMAACSINEADEATTPLGAFARAANFVGTCAATFPAGFTTDGLPVAVQLMGRPFEEPALLRAVAAYQSQTDWHLRRPPGLIE